MTGPNPAPNPAPAPAPAPAPQSMIGKGVEKGKKMGWEKARDGAVHYTIGRVCTWAFEGEKSRTRCMAATHLYDAGVSTATATAAGAGAVATAPTVVGGLALGGVMTYNIFRAEDSLVAGVRQLITGKETDSLADIAKKKAGAWIKKKWDGEDKPAAEPPAAEPPAAAPPATDAPMRGGFGPAAPGSGGGSTIV
jgi:hypothetical protein